AGVPRACGRRSCKPAERGGRCRGAGSAEAPWAGAARAAPSAARRSLERGGTRMRIAVCVEADGRAAALRRLLAGLAAQQFRARPEPEVFIIIVDVSVGGELREVVAGARDGFRWELEYVAARASQEARRRGIELAIGRGADRVAFLEAAAEPAPHWLAELRTAQARHEADVVEGPVVPRDADEVPAWVRRGGCFEAARRRTGAAVPLVRPYNVLVTRALLVAAGAASDESTTGQATSAGADRALAVAPRVVWADRAVVHSDVDPDRATARWILRRAFRERGRALPPHAVALGPEALAPSATRALVRMAEGGFLLSVAVFLGRAGVMHALCRVSRGAGELAAALRGQGARGRKEPA